MPKSRGASQPPGAAPASSQLSAEVGAADRSSDWELPRSTRSILPAPRGAAANAHAVSDQLLAGLAARLTERDRDICVLVSEHGPLSTRQLAEVFFSSEISASHRLVELHRLGALERFRPFRPTGSSPYLYLATVAGEEVAADRLGEHRHRPGPSGPTTGA